MIRFLALAGQRDNEKMRQSAGNCAAGAKKNCHGVVEGAAVANELYFCVIN